MAGVSSATLPLSVAISRAASEGKLERTKGVSGAHFSLLCLNLCSIGLPLPLLLRRSLGCHLKVHVQRLSFITLAARQLRTLRATRIARLRFVCYLRTIGV